MATRAFSIILLSLFGLGACEPSSGGGADLTDGGAECALSHQSGIWLVALTPPSQPMAPGEEARVIIRMQQGASPTDATPVAQQLVRFRLTGAAGRLDRIEPKPRPTRRAE